MTNESSDPLLESSLNLCAWMAALRLLILVPIFTGALLMAWLTPDQRHPSPRSAWTEEFELRPMSEYDPAGSLD